MTEKEAIEILRTAVGCCSSDVEYIALEKLISALPKHEHWETDKYGMDRMKCSVCGSIFEGDERWIGCPVCLTKMDGKE